MLKSRPKHGRVLNLDYQQEHRVLGWKTRNHCQEHSWIIIINHRHRRRLRAQEEDHILRRYPGKVLENKDCGTDAVFGCYLDICTGKKKKVGPKKGKGDPSSVTIRREEAEGEE